MSGETILANKVIIDETEKELINEFTFVKPGFEKYYTDVELLAGKKITLSEAIQELLNNALLQKWVESFFGTNNTAKENYYFFTH